MRFEISEEAIDCNHVLQLEYNGMECEIIEYMGHSTCIGRITGKLIEGIHYEVKWANGLSCPASESKLRKKRPKDEGARDWFNQNIDIPKSVTP